MSKKPCNTKFTKASIATNAENISCISNHLHFHSYGLHSTDTIALCQLQFKVKMTFECIYHVMIACFHNYQKVNSTYQLHDCWIFSSLPSFKLFLRKTSSATIIEVKQSKNSYIWDSLLTWQLTPHIVISFQALRHKIQKVGQISKI